MLSRRPRLLRFLGSFVVRCRSDERVNGRDGSDSNNDDRPRLTLHAAGSGPLAAFAYGKAPALRSRWAAYSLYRWEVAARDAAVVGVVGVAGLGRLLAEQTAGFAYPRMLTTVLALVVVTVFVDTISSFIRSALR